MLAKTMVAVSTALVLGAASAAVAMPHATVNAPRAVSKQQSAPVDRQTLRDSQGWRYSDGQWDRSCFRTLNYLSANSACGGGI
jgi:hypothetical protein